MKNIIKYTLGLLILIPVTICMLMVIGVCGFFDFCEWTLTGGVGYTWGTTLECWDTTKALLSILFDFWKPF